MIAWRRAVAAGVILTALTGAAIADASDSAKIDALIAKGTAQVAAGRIHQPLDDCWDMTQQELYPLWMELSQGQRAAIEKLIVAAYAPGAERKLFPERPLPLPPPAPPEPAAPATAPAVAATPPQEPPPPKTLPQPATPPAPAVAAVTPPPAPVQPPSPKPAPDPHAADYIARGGAAERRGDVIEARRWYQAAADTQDAKAALALGRLYDPTYLASLGVVGGVTGDTAQALRWYQRAISLGDADAEAPLSKLHQR